MTPTADDHALPMNTQRMATVLTYAGTLPFIAAALAPAFAIAGTPLATMIGAYAVAIISFIAGTHWAFHLGQHVSSAWKIVLCSNVITLAALAFYLFAVQQIALIGYVVLFIILFVIDKSAAKSTAEPAWFYPLRRNASAIVVICLLVLLLSNHS